jgi:chromosome segregation ATPase
MGNFWYEEPESNLNEIKNLKDIIDKMTVERHSNLKAIHELKEKVQEFENLNYESVKKEFRTKLNNEAKEFERYKDEFRKTLKLSQEDVNLQKNTIATLNSKIKSLEKEINDSKNLKFDSLTYSKLSKLEKCDLTKSIANPSLYPINSLVSDAGSILDFILHNTEEEIEDLISFLNQQLASYKSEFNLEINNVITSMRESTERIQLPKTHLEKFSSSGLSVLDLYNLLCDEYKVLYVSSENCRIERDKLRKDLKNAFFDFEKQLSNQHNLNTRNLDELNSQISELNNNMESLSNENVRINMLLEESNNSLVVKENEITNLVLKIHNSDQELAEVQEKLMNMNHSSDLEITSLRGELYETNKSIAELANSNIIIKNELTEKLLKIDYLRVQNSELETKYKISETKFHELESEKIKLLDNIKDFKNEISSCENNIKQLKDELGAKSDELIAITITNESVIKEYQENMNRREKDINQLEATVNLLKIQLSELNDKNKIEVSNLNKSLSDADVMIKNLNNELKSQVNFKF